MPWKPEDAPRFDKNANTFRKRKRWAHVANTILAKTGREDLAIRVASRLIEAEDPPKKSFWNRVSDEWERTKNAAVGVKPGSEAGWPSRLTHWSHQWQEKHGSSAPGKAAFSTEPTKPKVSTASVLRAQPRSGEAGKAWSHTIRREFQTRFRGGLVPSDATRRARTLDMLTRIAGAAHKQRSTRGAT